MTQTIIDQLIGHYNSCISAINQLPNGNIYDVREVLQKMETGRGICWCAMNEFGTDIYGDEWIASKKTDPNNFFFDIPLQADTRERAVELLQMRIDIMRTFPS